MSRVSLSSPRFVPPQVPILTSATPTGSGWIHEIKHDGFRALFRIDSGDVRAFTRSGHDWTDKYPRVVEACRKLRCRSAIIDGEVIVQDAAGVSDFAALRSAIEREPHRLMFFAFDLLFLNGIDLRQQPLIERRQALRKLMPSNARSPIQFNGHFEGDGTALFRQACAVGLEGIVSKRAASPYRSGLSKFWLETKNVVESDLILLGIDIDKEGKPLDHLGRDEASEMRYAGAAFLTLSGPARQDFNDKVERLACHKPPLLLRNARKAQWVKPKLQVRVRHLAGGDTLRHASVQEIVK